MKPIEFLCKGGASLMTRMEVTFRREHECRLCTTPCEGFKQYLKNRKRSLARQESEAALESLGLTKVKCAVSGRTYWE